MNQIHTTFPNPPSGQLNPEVPLGVSSTLVETPVPLDNLPFDEKNLNQLQWVYAGRFTISDSDNIGKDLFNWNSYRPFGEHWSSDIDIHGARIYLPQAMKEAYFATFSNIEWMIKYEPIKVTDSRVEVVQLYNFDGNIDAGELQFGNAETSSYNFENVQFTFDSPHKVVILIPPLYQMVTKLSNNDSIRIDTDGQVTQYVPIFLPTTSLSLKLKSRFVHNNLQPPNFEVNVWVYPIIRTLSQLHSRGLNTNVPHQSFPLVAFSPQPWWLKRNQDPIESLFFRTFDKLELHRYSLKDILSSMKTWSEEGTSKEVILKQIRKYLKIKT